MNSQPSPSWLPGEGACSLVSEAQSDSGVWSRSRQSAAGGALSGFLQFSSIKTHNLNTRL